MASIPLNEVQYQESHLYQDETHSLGGCFIVCFMLAFLSMVARVVSRRLTSDGLKIDDCILLIGAVRAYFTIRGRRGLITNLWLDCRRRVSHSADALWWVQYTACLWK